MSKTLDQLEKEVSELLKQDPPKEVAEKNEYLKELKAHKSDITTWLDSEKSSFRASFVKKLPHGTSVDGQWWRAVNRIYDDRPLNTEGSKLYGYRFNFAGEETIYLAQVTTTCVLEVKLDKNYTPYSIWPMGICLSNILDLSSREKCEKLNIDYDLLFGDWETLNFLKIPSYSQVISSVVRDHGYEGIYYESTKHVGHYCIAIFTCDLEKGSYLRLINVDKDIEIKPEEMELRGE